MGFKGGAVALGLSLAVAGAVIITIYVTVNRRARLKGVRSSWATGWLLAAPGMTAMGTGWGLLCLSGPRLVLPGGLVLGILLCVLAAGLYVASAFRVGRLRPPSRYTLGLHTGGVYRYVRHPQALALCILALGLALGTGSVPFIASLPLWIAFWTAYTYLEERFELIPTFGEEYLSYRKRTPRLLPIKFLRNR